MADIMELILADHLQIMRWAARLVDLHRRGRDDRAEPAATWETLAALIDLHMRADDEICVPAVLGDGPAGRAMTRQIRDGHDDIREIIRETSLQPPGSPSWWHLARTALSAWAAQLDTEQRGPLAACRHRADPALRERLAGQWRAFADARIRDQYPHAPAEIPTHRLRQDSRAPVTVPRLADPRFGPLACTCRVCTRALEWVLFRQRQHVPERPKPVG
jgi:hemerythrin HHE cation binding domain-containing protein